MNYRKKLYDVYVTTHTAGRYEVVSQTTVTGQYPVLRAYFGEFLPQNKDTRILDLGCGSGELVYWLRAEGYSDVGGVDISKEQLRRAEALGLGDLICEDLQTFLSHETDKYDLIIARDVLEHFTKDELMELLSHAHRALHPGGKIVIQTVNAANLFWGVLRYGDFTHEIAFTEASIAQVLLASGFKNLCIRPQPPVARGLRSAVRAVAWRGVQAIIRAYFLIERGSAPRILTQNLIVAAEK